MCVKKIISMLLVFTLLMVFPAVSLSFSSDFEGRVKVIAEYEGNGSLVVDYFYKGEKWKIEQVEPDKMVMFSDGDNMTVLMPQNKTYMEFSKDQLEQIQQMMGSGQQSDYEIDEDMDFEKTGKTKDIFGRECEQWVYEDSEKKVETWVTSGFGNFIGFKNPLDGGNAEDSKGLFGNPDLFPMEMTQWDKEGNETYKARVTEMEEKSLPDDLFTVPSDYKKMSVRKTHMK